MVKGVRNNTLFLFAAHLKSAILFTVVQLDRSLPLHFIHPDGWKFILIFTFITIILGQINVSLAWIGLILTVWCSYFFRNPLRVVPTRKGVIVSPADGKVSLIMKVVPPEELGLGDKELYRVSVFLNVFDVHVNRIPVGGVVEKILYHQGQFVNASLDKASSLNERNTVIIALDNGIKIGVVQIAGLIARRIRCDISENERIETGQVYGLIRFGSRMDVYLPVAPLVLEGQRMIAGETILAEIV